ncbi:hypothetical protein CI109_105825 [Kwoniella shandongensis]|uniref:Uncharacterized protein n=1 Tax=Kwoniella shandongensis TaxID=1734106 RepID=A0A5M6C495_9TREE|nr:uncharacterized protein CI109_003164 [Kwoniella shandongensis]KAA5528632.1 hypothetical protein CI109_003164 [Kwoniella shandongensis]
MGVNSPIPVRLQDETRKAAKILRSFVDVNNNGLDKVIPRTVLERATGFAIFTVFKAGFLFSARAGSGIVIARLQDGSWSPPSAIGLGGFGFGGQMGAEVTDFLIVLNSKAAVSTFMSAGSLTLGGNLSVAVGPLGRNAEGSGSVSSKGQVAAMYSYSKTKGLFGGVSVEGSVIVERQDANRLAYGGNPSAKQILSGSFDPPDWAMALVEQLDKATGLPGGQRWRSKDEDGEGGGMGWAPPGPGTPERKKSGAPSGGGYVFGEGLGGGGNTPPIGGGGGGGGGGRKRAGSLFGGAAAEKTGSPQRPGSANRRTSSFNPFNNGGSSSPRRGTISSGNGHTSEAYTAGLTWDSSGPMGLGIGNTGATTTSGTRSRSGSSGLRREGEVPQPFLFMAAKNAEKEKEKEKDLLGDWDGSRDTFGGKPTNGGGGRGGRNGYGSIGGEQDLLGKWDSDGTKLSASFARLGTNNDGGAIGRNRSDSKPSPYDDILEDKSRQRYSSGQDYTPRETQSTFAAMDWATTSTQRSSPSKLTKPPTGSRARDQAFAFDAPSSRGDFSPFDDEPVGRLRADSGARRKPFEDYIPNDDLGSSRGGGGGKPDIRLKAGLEQDHLNDGYPRAVGLFDFNTGTAGDLAFKAGEIVVITDKVDDNGDWWRGRLGSDKAIGREGIFPSTYVEVLEIPKELRGGVGRSELRRRIGKTEFD